MSKQYEFEITGEKKPVTNLYELMGMVTNPYKAKTVEEYSASLKGMTFADLQDHATEVGVPSYDDRERLVNSLIESFARTVGQFNAAIKQSEEADAELKKKSVLSKDQQKQVDELLSRGR